MTNSGSEEPAMTGDKAAAAAMTAKAAGLGENIEAA